VQLVTLRKPLDCSDGLVLDGQRQCQARKHPSPVNHDSASAALAVIATLFGAGETGVLSQRIEQRRASQY
jgi:hypothetical protein